MDKINTKIASVKANSIAEELGIEQGDTILSINENPITDILEYKFLINDDFITVVVQKPDGEEWELEIEKEYGEDLGIEFESALIDEARSCKNKCIFCFIDQLPKNMRKTLYFKDDDSRLSFLQGNYITLTNLSDFDIQKIIKYKISPLNVSVHTTDPELRVKMLNNRFAGNVMEVLKKLADGGIVLNAQIVLCRDVNDGKNLDKTIGDLTEVYPALRSVSVVPVGLTKHRQGLFELKAFDKEKSIEVIEKIEEWQRKAKKEYRTNFVYLADEFYIMADRDIPDYKSYEDFPQIENGVGLIALFKKEFDDYLKQLKKNNYKLDSLRTVSVISGTSAFDFIDKGCRQLEKDIGNIKINNYRIINHFFGETVTVSGLITGSDIIKQLKDKCLGDELIIPDCMLRHGENVFLDDITTPDLEKELNVKTKITNVNGKSFINSILGR